MDSLGDVLNHKKLPNEPEEVRLLKAYVLKRYQVVPSVLSAEHHITLVVPHAALASMLQLEITALATACNITKKLYIRIGA